MNNQNKIKLVVEGNMEYILQALLEKKIKIIKVEIVEESEDYL